MYLNALMVQKMAQKNKIFKIILSFRKKFLILQSQKYKANEKRYSSRKL